MNSLVVLLDCIIDVIGIMIRKVRGNYSTNLSMVRELFWK